MNLYIWQRPTLSIVDLGNSPDLHPNPRENAKALIQLMYFCLPQSTLMAFLEELGVDYVQWAEVRERTIGV